MNTKKIRIGIVVEYNPFHNGHIYQIKQIKKLWPNSQIIVAMSGKYVQRGEIAIASFEERRKIALQHQIDEVYEINQKYVVQAAHIFAQEAIKELNKHQIDILCFGSETNKIDDFILIAKTILNNEDHFYQLIKKEMKKGFSFPKANQLVLEKLVQKSFVLPNDILGLEYVKTIMKNNYNIKPVCLKRSVGFHSMETNGNIASATYIRQLIYQQSNDYQQYTPMRFDFHKIDRIENYYNVFKEIIISSTPDQLKQYLLVSEGIENLLKKNVQLCSTYDEFINLTNSKRYTSSRIKRIMLAIILNLKKND